MTARLWILSACGISVLIGASLQAQNSPNGPIVGRVSPSKASEGPRPGLIYGEPYSATTEYEHSQTLADGTRIEQKRNPEEKTFRDSQGRTRRESYRSTSMAGDAPTTLETIMINDPIAGVEYYLHPQSLVACQGSPYGFGYTNQGGTGQCTFTPPPSGQARPVTNRIPAPTATSPSQRPHNEIVTEDLGTQEMEGLTVTGTRTTITLPVGAQGNDRPMESVGERWFSKELNIYVLIKSSDPLHGETTLRTTHIDRSEPDPSLFQVPPDYTIERRE